MAERPFEIRRGFGLGQLAALVVAGFVLVPLAAVLIYAGGASGLRAADWAALRFTLWQAVLSAVISVALAVPVARALARRRFVGRGLLITLLGAPFILPVIVAVLGLLAVFGRAGVLNVALGWLGLPPVQVYGLHGVVLAHVFFNLPLATRMLLQGWQAIPAERFRLAATLGMGARDVTRVLERPMLRQVAPGAAMVIFAICLTSFAVALTLGGGPRATTVELAIYQAFHFEFDLGRVAVMASLQMALACVAALVALWVAVPTGLGAGLDRVPLRWDAAGVGLRVLDAGVLGLVALFLVTPLAMVVLRGAVALPGLDAPVWRAAGVSLGIAIASAFLCVALALAMAQTRRGWVEMAGYLGIAASPLVIGAGLFLILNPVLRPSDLAVPVTISVNALAALPFCLRILSPELRAVERDFGQLADQLGMAGRARLRLLILPRLRRTLGFCLGLSAALSMGDLGVIALFADPDFATLPLQILRLMGAYRMEDAAGAGLLLLLLSLALFWSFDRGGRGDAER
ncbi:MAG: thiamine/thiamine pyrophosphate ABC transporter permease ThiP [Rhodobacterales bacterium]|nr:MAG: thiamine/thiamine pyrophosphate ABC transporter permease ThiP [Rhodobacterales bacterium]